MKLIARIVGGLVLGYALLFATVTAAMLQTPERFGRFMMYMPEPVVFRVLPGPRIWLWARSGSLEAGDRAPDFELSTHDQSARVALSSHRGRRPVVLVFGSYT